MTAEAQSPTISLADGAEIPQLGFGVAMIPQASAIEVVTQAFAAGYRQIDTAAAYGNEAEVGQAYRASGLGRDEVFITTKLDNSDHGHGQAKQALKASLERLELDYVDLYLIHWPLPARGKYVESWRALIELREEGVVRSIGVSNFQPAHLTKIVEATGVEPTVNQVELHPYLQQAGLRREHADRGIVTEAWSPLAMGEVLDDEVIAGLAEAHGRTPSQIVLRWHIELGNVVFPKSVTPERIVENFRVFDFQLTETDMDEIAALDEGRRTGDDPDTFAG